MSDYVVTDGEDVYEVRSRGLEAENPDGWLRLRYEHAGEQAWEFSFYADGLMGAGFRVTFAGCGRVAFRGAVCDALVLSSSPEVHECFEACDRLFERLDSRSERAA